MRRPARRVLRVSQGGTEDEATGAPPGLRSAHRPAIQGMRAVAVLLVVAYHAGLPVPGGFTGVDVFFVISGFVITEMLHREWTRTGSIDLVRFVRRRVRRLLPALALVVSVTVLISVIVEEPVVNPERTPLTGLGALLVGANVVIAATTGDYFDEPAELNPLLHLWSLSVEEQFYLVLPLLLLLAWRRMARGHARTALGAVATAGAVSGLLMIFGPQLAAATPIPLDTFGFYSPVVRAWEFLVGVALALTAGWRRAGPRGSLLAGVAGAGLLVWGALSITADTVFPGPATLAPVIGTALLIVATESRSGVVHRLLSLGPMTAIGDRSYAWYLWHWPFIVLSGLILGNSTVVGPAAALISVIPTALAYRYVEQPMRQRPDTSVLPMLRTWLLLPVVLTAGLAVAAANAYFQPAIADARTQLGQRSVAQQAGCHTLDAFTTRRTDRCWFGSGQDDPTVRPIYLLGDSLASTAADAVIPAAAQLDRPAFVASAPACPIVVGGRPGANDACGRFVTEALTWLASSRPGDVVLAASDAYWFTVGSVEVDRDGYRTALRATVEAVVASGHRPVLVLPVPMFVGFEDEAYGERWRLGNCNLVAFLRDDCGRAATIGPAWPQQPVWAATREVAAGTGAGLVDATRRICPDGVCRTDVDGRWHYRDGWHPSAGKASQLVDLYVDALRR